MSNVPLLSMLGICKSFYGIQVLTNVDFEVNAGEIVALIGENGAGKSTLMKILLGMYHAERGSISIEGKTVNITSPRVALDKGISMIHQEICLVPDLSIAENIWLGREPTYNGLMDWKKLNAKTFDLMKQLRINLNPRDKVRSLSVAEKQMVEIVRAISYDAKLVIMDEPTSALTEAESIQLYGFMRDLKAKGISIIFITHKMREVFEVVDKAVILRDGCRIAGGSIKDFTPEQVIKHMVGREMTNIYPKRDAHIGDVAVEIKNLSKEGVFHNISLKAHKGEVLGITGLLGAKRTELMNALFGVDSFDSGEIYIEGKKVNITNPHSAINASMGMVMEDRKKMGLVMCRPIVENVALPNYDLFSKGMIANNKMALNKCKNIIKQLSIKARTPFQVANSLSGGNQQKVCIAKWLVANPKIMIMDEPTRGIDVGAKYEIYQLMNKLTSEGMCIIMISSELPEILGMSDRIIVMHEGSIQIELDREEATQEKIMRYAVGGVN